VDVPPEIPRMEDWVVVGPGGASRWQLENEKDKEKKGKEQIISSTVSKEQEETAPIVANSKEDDSKNVSVDTQTNETAEEEENSGEVSFEVDDENKNEKYWATNRDIFNNNLEKIFPLRLNSNIATHLITKADSYLAKKNSGENVNLEEIEFSNYRNNFMNLYPQNKIDLSLFAYCFKKSLEEYINNSNFRSTVDKRKQDQKASEQKEKKEQERLARLAEIRQSINNMI